MALNIQAQQHSEERMPSLVFRGNGDSPTNFLKLVDGRLLNRPDVVGHARMIAFTAGFLADAAQLWYFEWIGDVAPANVQSTYAQFKAAMLAVFVNPADQMAARLELSNLKFEDFANVSAYFAAFHKTCLRLPEVDGPERAYRFAETLPAEIRAFVLERNPQNLIEAKSSALIYEGAHLKSGAARTSQSQLHALEIRDLKQQLSELHAMASKSWTPSKSQDHAPQYKSNPKSYTKLSPPDHARCMAENRCFKCRKTGHSARECRSQASSSFPM